MAAIHLSMGLEPSFLLKHFHIAKLITDLKLSDAELAILMVFQLLATGKVGSKC